MENNSQKHPYAWLNPNLVKFKLEKKTVNLFDLIGKSFVI